jgi:hypothetical protein
LAIKSDKYSLISRVKDGKHLNIDDLEHYSLLLQLGINSFQVCITDIRKNACLLLEDFELHQFHSIDATIACLKQLFDDHHFLLANFWNTVTFSIKNEKFTLVPEDYFSESQIDDYLKFGVDLNSQEEQYFYSEIKEIGALSVFAIDKKIMNFLNQMYVNVTYKLVHHSCGIIKAILKNKDLRPYPQIYANLDAHALNLTVIANGSLIFYNSFKIKNPSDLVRYTILVAKAFNIDLKHHGIVVWSSIKNDTPYLKELSKYIKHVQQGHGPSFLKLSFEFDEIPEHQYLDVYGIHLCA